MNPVPDELAGELERVRAAAQAAELAAHRAGLVVTVAADRIMAALEAANNAQAEAVSIARAAGEAVGNVAEHARAAIAGVFVDPDMPRRFVAELDRWAFDNADELAAAPITGTAGNARAHRARIHARYLARRAVRERSATHFPGSDDEQRTTTYGLARVLAFAAERARVIAAELVDTAPAAAAVLAAVAKCWHELCVRLLELVHCTPQHPTRCTRGLAPPGRHPLSVAVAAHAPPGGRVCHARPHGRIHAFTDPGPP